MRITVLISQSTIMYQTEMSWKCLKMVPTRQSLLCLAYSPLCVHAPNYLPNFQPVLAWHITEYIIESATCSFWRS